MYARVGRARRFRPSRQALILGSLGGRRRLRRGDRPRKFLSPIHSSALAYILSLQSARSICSSFCSTFSTLGEVFAWLGEGSNELERQACCEFAESIADGRTVTILAEGEETALFWLEVGGTEYASAQVCSFTPSR